jgi:hypothetical protein
VREAARDFDGDGCVDLVPELAGAVDAEVSGVDLPKQRLQLLVAQACGSMALRQRESLASS